MNNGSGTSWMRLRKLIIELNGWTTDAELMPKEGRDATKTYIRLAEFISYQVMDHLTRMMHLLLFHRTASPPSKSVWINHTLHRV